MIWLAVTSPTPGKVSSCSAVAVFRSSGTPGGPAPPAAPVPPGWAVPEDPDQLAVDELAGEVDRFQLGARRGAAGRLDRVEDPAALGQADEPWVLDSPDDVDGDGGARRLAGGGAIAALGGTVGPGTRQDQACPAAAGERGGWRVGGARLGVQPQGSGGGQGQDSDDGDGDALARDTVEQALEAGPPAGGLHDERGRR